MGVDEQKAKRKLAETSPEIATVGNMSTAALMKLMNDTMSMLLDKKIANLPTKSDIMEIKNNIEGVKEEVTRLSEENKTMKAEIKLLKEINDANERKLERLDVQSRRKNIIVRGLPLKSSLYGAVKDFFRNKLKINMDVEIEYVKKLKQANDKMTVLIELKSGKMIADIFKNTKHLAGSTIFVERDLCGIRLERKKIMMQLKKEILQVDKSKKIGIRGDQLVVGGKIFFWTGNDELMCGQRKGKEVLAEEYGVVAQNILLDYNNLLSKYNSKN